MNVKLKINPAAGKEQRLVLLLNKIGEAVNFSFTAPPQEGKIIRVPISGVPAGDYLVRLSINGIESPLQQDKTTGKFNGPQIRIGAVPPAIKQLRSTNIEFTFSEAGSTVTLTGAVTVKDGNGMAINDVNVAISWTLPDGTIMTQSAATAANGVATFTIQNGRGNYQLKVKSLTKTNYVFDPNSPGQVLEKSISIFASNKLIAKTLELSGIQKEGGVPLLARGRVFVRDENNLPILEATVRLRWTFSNQAGINLTEEQTAFSKTDGIAWFTFQKGEGIYRVEVLGIEKGAYSFAPEQGTTQKERALPNVYFGSGSIGSTAKQEADNSFTVKSSITLSAEAVAPELPEAIVIARWVLPGPTNDPALEKWQERVTDARGRATFEINNGRGQYRFFISDVFKDGYTFRVGGGLSDEIIVP